MRKKTNRVFTVLRILLFLLGAGLLVWFIVPVYVGVCNIGNCSGMAAAVLWMAACLFYPQIKKAVKLLWRKSTGGRVLVSAVLTLLIMLITGTAVLSGLMLYAANKTPPANAPVIVLGCKVNSTVPSLMLAKRLEAAKAYLQSNPQAVCVVSGGKGDGEDISEAQAMRDSLIAGGVEADRIIMEDASTNTQENIALSKEILLQKGVTGPIAVVTDGFHELRAGIIAKKQGLEPYSVPANTPWFTFSAYYVRELFALAQEILLH